MLEFALFPGVPDLAICLRFGCFLIWAPGADPGSFGSAPGFIRSGAPHQLRVEHAFFDQVSLAFKKADFFG